MSLYARFTFTCSVRAAYTADASLATWKNVYHRWVAPLTQKSLQTPCNRSQTYYDIVNPKPALDRVVDVSIDRKTAVRSKRTSELGRKLIRTDIILGLERGFPVAHFPSVLRKIGDSLRNRIYC